MVEREFLGARYLGAFIIATTVFVLFFVFAHSVSYINYQRISYQNDYIQQSIDALEQTLSNFSCDDRLLIESSGRLDNVASKLTLMEKRFGKLDYRVLEQKKLYSDLEMKHFNLTKEFEIECNKSYVTIFFFYSNRNLAKERESERTGFVLTTFERLNGDKIMIYSFDYDLDLPLVKDLAAKYDITNVPMVVVNEKDVIYVHNLDDLEPYFNKI